LNQRAASLCHDGREESYKLEVDSEQQLIKVRLAASGEIPSLQLACDCQESKERF